MWAEYSMATSRLFLRKLIVGDLWNMALLAPRIVYEERFLRRELTGYNAYAERMRFRLVPFVW